MKIRSVVNKASRNSTGAFAESFPRLESDFFMKKDTLTKKIPSFPEFANVTPELKDEIESFLHKYEPYSDFNFYSLYSWDTVKNRKVSELNNNLVVQMTEYETGEPLLSFLGTNKQEETTKTLIEYARTAGISDTLFYVPEISVSEINDPIINVTEKRGDFDYVFSVKDIASLKGNKYSKKRQLVNVFTKNNPDAAFVMEEMANITSDAIIFGILKNWQKNKINSDKECDLEHEPVAIDRLLKMDDKNNLMVSYILLNNEAIAFSIDEILPNRFALAHYSKFDTSFRGINEFLNHKIANELTARGVKLWNWEQDLDIEDLRYSKMSYMPTKFIKKYCVNCK